jgi:hypothetical protein
MGVPYAAVWLVKFLFSHTLDYRYRLTHYTMPTPRRSRWLQFSLRGLLLGGATARYNQLRFYRGRSTGGNATA